MLNDIDLMLSFKDVLIVLWLCRKLLVTKSSSTLCKPMDWDPPGFSIHGIFQARILEWIALSFSRGTSFPTQGSKPGLPHRRQTLYRLSHLGKAIFRGEESQYL